MLNERLVRNLDRQVESWRFRVKDDEERKTYDEVFDQKTLKLLQKLFSDQVLSTLDYPVSTGKEGNVFKATSPLGSRAVKIYRTSNATFKDLARYIEGDPRFRDLRGNLRKIIPAWASKEYKNLIQLKEGGVRVPTPYFHTANIVIMEYVGDDQTPAPLIRKVTLPDPQRAVRDILAQFRKINKAGLVHGDFSEYNLLWWKGKPWVIDVAQSVPLEHSQGAEWLQRDVENLLRYAKQIGAPLRRESVLKGLQGLEHALRKNPR